jgi:hypothetical protein
MGTEPKMLDPDPDSMNLDPKHCTKQNGPRLPSIKAGNSINGRYWTTNVTILGTWDLATPRYLADNSRAIYSNGESKKRVGKEH